MKLLVLQFLILGWATAVFPDDSSNAQEIVPHHLNEQETLEVKQKLEAFDQGNVALDGITENSESDMKLIEYYLSSTNNVTTRMKLPISKSFAIWSQYPRVAQLAQDYVNVYSNDWRGWSILAGSKIMLKSYYEAIAAYTNAIRLGDEKNCLGLGIAALAVDRIDILEKIVVPRLLVQMNETDEFPEKKRNQMRGCIIGYAFKSDKKGIFIRVVTGVDFSKIYQWPELENLITLGCKKFKGPDIDKIRQELESANSVSSPAH